MRKHALGCGVARLDFDCLPEILSMVVAGVSAVQCVLSALDERCEFLIATSVQGPPGSTAHCGDRSGSGNHGPARNNGPQPSAVIARICSVVHGFGKAVAGSRYGFDPE